MMDGCTKWHHGIPSQNLFHQRFNIRKPRPVSKRRKTMCSYDGIDLDLSSKLSLRIALHGEEEALQCADGLSTHQPVSRLHEIAMRMGTYGVCASCVKPSCCPFEL